ncbi:LemA family protein [Gordonia sp. CPCC 205333]|uniref:LemA family protein n=1 Tax=Gordonia sp. CPCC 205333 TaxID=3140790 RepID=UPI003AF393A1
MIWIYVAIAVVVLITVGTWPIRARNRLVSMQTTVAESWRNVDIELARRWDLIPQLVAVAKAYAAHEAQTLANLVALRTGAGVSADPAHALAELSDHVIADETRQENELSTAVAQLRTVAEAYPQLRSSDHYSAVITNLRDTEDRIAAARRLYNGNVSRYNAALHSFPASTIARRAAMTRAEFFEIADAHKGLPRLEL